MLIQLSNKEKSIEETKYIPGMQNGLDFAEHYVMWNYRENWEKLGYVTKSDGLFYVRPRTAAVTWEVWRGFDIVLHDRLDGTQDIDYVTYTSYGEKKSMETLIN